MLVAFWPFLEHRPFCREIKTRNMALRNRSELKSKSSFECCTDFAFWMSCIDCSSQLSSCVFHWNSKQSFYVCQTSLGDAPNAEFIQKVHMSIYFDSVLINVANFECHWFWSFIEILSWSLGNDGLIATPQKTNRFRKPTKPLLKIKPFSVFCYFVVGAWIDVCQWLDTIFENSLERPLWNPLSRTWKRMLVCFLSMESDPTENIKHLATRLGLRKLLPESFNQRT